MDSKLFGEPGALPGASSGGTPQNMVGSPATAAPMPAMGAMPAGGQQPASKLMGAPPAPPPVPSVDDLTKGLHDTAYLRGKLQTLLSAEKLPTRKQILDLSSDLMARRVMSPQRIATELATLPEQPDEILKWVEQHYQTTDRQIDQLTMLLHNAADAEHPLNSGRMPTGQ